MKYLYQCSRCGAQFDEYDDCAKHENHHRELSIQNTDYRLQEYVEYSSKSLYPETIYSGFMDYEQDERNGKAVILRYKLVGVSEKISDLYNNKVAEERRIYEQEQIERDTNRVNMLAQLDANGIDCSAINTKSYWAVTEFYQDKMNSK